MTRALAVDFDPRRIDAIFAGLDQCRLPGAAVGIAINGVPVYRKGFGLASIELPVCLSPSMRIRIGSTTKQFTCFAYLLLCEEGRAQLDDPLGKHLPEVHPVIRGITLRQLMGNIGGLRDALAIISQFRGHLSSHVMRQPTSDEEVLSLYRRIDDIDMPAGAAWRYNNGGFLLLSLVIERVAGQPLEDVMRERIFRPLGMHDTLLRRLDTDFVPNSATPHHLNGAGEYERAYFGYGYAGAGAIASTADDMLRWLANMDTSLVGSAETWQAMKTPQRLSNGSSSGYSCGLFIDRYRGAETIHHAGGWVGSSAQMLKVPAAGLDIVVLANRGDVPSVLCVNQILDACLPGLDPVRELRKRPFASGLFRSALSGRVIHLFEQEGTQIASIDGLDVPVESDDEGVLWAAGLLAALKKGVRPIGAADRPTALRYGDAGSLDELEAVTDASAFSAEAIAGRYLAETTGIEATICAGGAGQPRLRTTSRFGAMDFQLEHLGSTIWRARPHEHTDGVLTFADDGSAFCFSSLFIRALRFRRCS